MSGGNMAEEKWEDFKVSDADREYVAKTWGLLYLADVFVGEVIEHYTTEGVRNVKNKHLALRRWIQRASPNGRYYQPSWWERKSEQARRLHKSPVQARVETITPRSRDTWKPTPTGEQAIKDIRALLEPYADLLK